MQERRAQVKNGYFVLTVSFVVLALLVPLASADNFPALGPAANFGVLGLQGSETITNSLVTINGNEGAVYNSKINNMAPSVVTGNVYVGVATQYGGPGTINGSLIVDQSLMGNSSSIGSVQTAVNNAITQIGTYSNWQAITYSNTANNVFNASSTLTELKINGDLTLNNSSSFNITLSGSSSQYFVVQITGNMNLTGNASLVLTGGIDPSHVIYYFSGATCDINTHVSDVVNGIVLAPNCGSSGGIDGTWNGELIFGKSASLMSGATFNQPVTQTPEPAALVLFASALPLLLRRRRGFSA